VNVSSFIACAPKPSPARSDGISARRRAGLLRVAGFGAAGSLLAVGQAFAQATSTAGSLGAQLNTMSSEFIDSGGTALGMVCYIAAMLCFVGGAWAFWQSRQPQNRESGYVAKGIAGLVLCGLLVMMPQWVNKAAHTVAGADASINNTPAQIKFAP
jgi:hypothetical protein